MKEVEKTCDQAAIIREGKLVAVEDMEKLRSNKQKIVEFTFETAGMASEFASKLPKDSQTNGRTVVSKSEETLMYSLRRQDSTQ